MPDDIQYLLYGYLIGYLSILCLSLFLLSVWREERKP